METLRTIKKGDYFKLKENGKIYVRDDYDRETKKFGYYDFYDINNYHEKKGDTQVITDFEF